ncbi:MAG: DUF6799 domain-containing protein [Candidatus Binataceae bacterium]
MRTYQTATLLAVSLVAALLTVAPSPIATARAGQDMDGVIMQKGRVMTMKRGKPMAPVDSAMTTSNGSKIMPNGTVKMKNGGEMHLENGEMMMMDGYVMKGGKAKAMEK